MHSPLTPILIKSNLIPLDPYDWSLCGIWLAKPPLALWIMSYSMHIFGVNDMGLRLPSLIFSVLSVYLTFLIGRKLFNEKTGLIAAFFYAINGLLYEVNIGLLSGDHVDTLFHLLFLVSVYVVIYHDRFSVKKTGLILGVLIGGAFLTKWIMSFFICMVCLLYFVYVRRSFREGIAMVMYMLIPFLLICCPWLFYIHYTFPTETALIIKGMFQPISTVVQQHYGPWYYYLNSIRININELIYVPIIFLLYKSTRRITKERFLLLVWIFVPLVLLSISATKREVYMLMSATPLFITMAWFIIYLRSLLRCYGKLTLLLNALFFIAAIRYSVERLKPMQPWLVKPEYMVNMEKLLSKTNLPADSVVLISEPFYIESGFYYGIHSYRYVNDSTVNAIKLKGYTVFENAKGKYLPK